MLSDLLPDANAGALTAIDRALATGEHSARLLMTAARVMERAGQQARARRFRRDALAQNPQVEILLP